MLLSHQAHRPHAEHRVAGDDAVIVQRDFQRRQDPAQTRRGGDIGIAGRSRAGRVVVRQHHAARVEVEGPPHDAAQRDRGGISPPAVVEILGDEQPLAGEEQRQHALLPLRAQPLREISAEVGFAGIERPPLQRLARRRLCEAARGQDGGADLRPALPRRAQGVLQRLRRGGPDRAQRAEPADQRARGGERLGAGAGLKELRQDG